MAVDELSALRLGELGIRQEIDVPAFQRCLIPRPENIEGIAQDLFVGKIAPMPDAQPLVTKLCGHVNGICLAKGLIKEHRHRKAAAVGGDRQEERSRLTQCLFRCVCDGFSHILCPIHTAVGGVDDGKIRRETANGIAAVEGIILPVVAGEKETLPIHGDVVPDRAGAVSRPSPAERELAVQGKLRCGGVKDHGVLRLVMDLLVGLV